MCSLLQARHCCVQQLGFMQQLVFAGVKLKAYFVPADAEQEKNGQQSLK